MGATAIALVVRRDLKSKEDMMTDLNVREEDGLP
jgi:hypothetical protein